MNHGLTPPQIRDYDPRWPAEFAELAAGIRAELAAVAVAVEHIGSTSVPGLPAKDVIDVMAVVEAEAALDDAAARLGAAGWAVRPPGVLDHPVPGLPDEPAQWVKRFAHPPDSVRPLNLHLRVAGRANARYAVLFRDYLRAHPRTAAAYGEAKRRLAPLCDSTLVYAEAKDPVCDLVYLPAEEWGARTGWREPWAAIGEAGMRDAPRP